MKILVIEDEKDIAELIEYNLRQEKFFVEFCLSGNQGLSKARHTLPDLIILDLMLPDVGGLEVCKTLKGDPKTAKIPVLILTAKAEEVDRIVGFEVGADDYLAKPFSPRELVLRVKAILRRIKEKEEISKTALLTFGLLRLDPSKFQTKVGEKEVRLTAIEFKLLQYLLSSKGRVATRDMLLDQVWGYEAALTTRTVDTHVKRLREKLGKAGDYIETIRGIGYRFKEKAE
ncbi:MAG: response regulator transcription factor [Deltaproteobacteria bacterium]|nr:response regulator transcription factor [Deltaproteobacteria bacterium]